jgi:serine/threonine protein kinase
VMLGKGAFGTVVQFIERDTNKKVAIKILLKERLSEQEMNFVQ